jgi:hypothetical protein
MGILNLGLDIAISVLVSEIRLVFPLSENSSGGGASKWSKRPRGEIKVKYVGKRREITGNYGIFEGLELGLFIGKTPYLLGN